MATLDSSALLELRAPDTSIVQHLDTGYLYFQGVIPNVYLKSVVLDVTEYSSSTTEPSDISDTYTLVLDGTIINTVEDTQDTPRHHYVMDLKFRWYSIKIKYIYDYTDPASQTQFNKASRTQELVIDNSMPHLSEKFISLNIGQAEKQLLKNRTLVRWYGTTPYESFNKGDIYSVNRALLTITEINLTPEFKFVATPADKDIVSFFNAMTTQEHFYNTIECYFDYNIPQNAIFPFIITYRNHWYNIFIRGNLVELKETLKEETHE